MPFMDKLKTLFKHISWMHCHVAIRNRIPLERNKISSSVPQLFPLKWPVQYTDMSSPWCYICHMPRTSARKSQHYVSALILRSIFSLQFYLLNWTYQWLIVLWCRMEYWYKWKRLLAPNYFWYYLSSFNIFLALLLIPFISMWPFITVNQNASAQVLQINIPVRTWNCVGRCFEVLKMLSSTEFSSQKMFLHWLLCSKFSIKVT